MSDTNSPNPPEFPGAASNRADAASDRADAQACDRARFRRGCGRRGGRKVVLVVALIGAFFAGGVVFSHVHAFGEDAADGPHRVGWMHHAAWDAQGPNADRPDGPPLSEADRLVHARDQIDHALTGIEASADQKTKVLAIFDAAAVSLKDIPVDMFQTRLQMATLMTAPTIDRDKLEALRAARVGEADTASKTIVKALADAADVLTPVQRVRLAMAIEHLHHAPPPRN